MAYHLDLHSLLRMILLRTARRSISCPTHGATQLRYLALIRHSKSQTRVHMQPSELPEITVQELKSLIDMNEKFVLLDVRKDWEYSIVNLGGRLIPLDELLDRIDELSGHENDLVVVHCRSGGRSAQAVLHLLASGFSNVKNLAGGTLAWSKEIDPTKPTY